MNLAGLRFKRTLVGILLVIILSLPAVGARRVPGWARANDQQLFHRPDFKAISLRTDESQSLARKGSDAVTTHLICGESDSLIPDLVEHATSLSLRDPAERTRLLTDSRGRAPPTS